MTGSRTYDQQYGADYWNTLDDGRGYTDSVLWEDLAGTFREVFGYSPDKRDDLTIQTRVLDIGCAMGFLVRHLRRRAFDARGVDVSEYAIKNAPPDVRERLSRYDLTSESPPDVGRWDLVICLETLEHIPEAQINVALEHIKAAMAPGGVAVLAICTEEVPGWDSDPTHVCIHPAQWWDDRLMDVGFQRLPEREAELRRYRWFAHHPGLFVVEVAE